MNEARIGSTLESLFDELGERAEFDLLLDEKRLSLEIERAKSRQNRARQGHEDESGGTPA